LQEVSQTEVLYQSSTGEADQRLNETVASITTTRQLATLPTPRERG
jgi:hypothetical protein